MAVLTRIIAVVTTWLLVGALAASCAGTGAKNNTERSVQSPRQGVAIFRSSTFHFSWYRDVEPVEANLERCVTDAIGENFAGLQYIPRSQFCKVAFPNLPVESAPLQLESIRVLLEEPKFQKRLQSMNLRYIIYVGGKTETLAADHWWVGGGGYMAATAVGASWWEKESYVSALIFDLQNTGDSQTVEQTTAGTSWVGGLLPFAVGMPANTEDRACRNIGERVVEALTTARNMEVQQ